MASGALDRETSGSEGHGRFEEVLAAYLQDAERGKAPDREALIAAHPELAEDLRDFFKNREVFADRGVPPGQARSAQDLTVHMGPASALGGGLVDGFFWIPAPGKRVGDYELLEEIGRGGMGVVYKAREISLSRLVALKMILSGQLASQEEIKRFKFDAQAAADLDHPNIVRIYHIDQYHGYHYFTMKLIEGGSLAKRVEDFAGKPDKAAQLVAAIAWAVHHAHQRGILHRDLKPPNVLLDRSGQPHVTDFGLACRTDARNTHLTSPGQIIGTLRYMSPEQAMGDVKAITTASDVYAVGVILYELLTGRPPFEGNSQTEILRQVVEVEPQRPRLSGLRIKRDLETICMKCLEKEPQRRYGSAERLARDLEHYLNDEPIDAPYVGRTQRIWRWCLRFPMLAASVASAATFLIIMTLAALAAARTQQQQVLELEKQANSAMAKHAASTVLLQLRQYELAVVEAARDPGLLRELMRLADLPKEQRFKTTELKPLNDALTKVVSDTNQKYRVGEQEPFDSWFPLDRDGMGLVRAPASENPEWTGSDFHLRDYFEGAGTSARKAKASGRVPTPYVSGVFKSHSDGKGKFAISMPVLADDGAVVGVLAGTLTIGATFGSRPLSEPPRKVVLVGPEDPSIPGTTTRPAERPDPRLGYVIAYDRSRSSQPERMTGVGSERLRAFGALLKRGDRPNADDAMDDNYQDPISGGRWVAAFAQVGDTKLLVVVQTPYDNPLAPARTLAKTLMRWLLVALAIGGAYFLVAGVYARRKRSRP